MADNGFTLSFTLMNQFDTSAFFDSPIEILYVGDESGNKDSGGYFRMTHEGGVSVCLDGVKKETVDISVSVTSVIFSPFQYKSFWQHRSVLLS